MNDKIINIGCLIVSFKSILFLIELIKIKFIARKSYERRGIHDPSSRERGERAISYWDKA